MDTNKTTTAKPAGFQKTSEPQAFGEMAQKGTRKASRQRDNERSAERRIS